MLRAMEKKDIIWPGPFVDPFRGCKTILALGAARASRLNKLCNATGARGVGIELSSERVRLKRSCGLTTLICGDACELIMGYKDNSFDGIAMFDLLHCLTKEQAIGLVQETKRVAKKVVVTSLPVGHVQERTAVTKAGHEYPGAEEIAQKSFWTREEAFELWGEGLESFYYDPDHIERAHRKKGKEYVDWLRETQYHGRFAVMTLAVWRKGERR